MLIPYPDGTFLHAIELYCINTLKDVLNIQQTATLDAGAFADGIERENDILREQLKELRDKPTIDQCLSHRCMKHRDIPMYNRNEISGAECAACAVDDAIADEAAYNKGDQS